MSFMVRDKHGNVWPPQFKSDLCDPASPHSMLSAKAKSLASALDAANAARAQGKGWGTGEIAHLAKPLIPKGAEVVPARNAVYQHKWLCHGCGQSRTTTAGSKKLRGVKVCAECVAAAAGKATA
jgi:hypothetical protein